MKEKTRSAYILQKHVQLRMRAGVRGHLEQRTKQVVKKLFKVVDNAVQLVDIARQQKNRLLKADSSTWYHVDTYIVCCIVLCKGG